MILHFDYLRKGGMITRDIALVVDDVELNREILSEMLEDDFKTLEACDGLEALEIIKAHSDDIAVLLLDLVMPNLGGIDILKILREDNLLDKFPVLIITGESSLEIEEQCLTLGAFDFIKKPFNPAVVSHRTKNAVSLFTYKNHLEDLVTEQTAQLRQQTEELQQKNLRLEKTNESTIELLSTVVESRNLESGTHVRRVKEFTRILAEKLKEKYPEYGLTDRYVYLVSIASSMHDVGKIMISDTVLLKPGKLTPEEFDYMKTHTLCGCEVLEHSRHMWDKEYFDLCWQICRYHHEKWDGRGYPEGLKEDEIPISAQLVSVADCYDALTTERVYKKAFTPDKAFEMISNGECGQFNPKVMDCFSSCKEQFSDFAAQCASVAINK